MTTPPITFEPCADERFVTVVQLPGGLQADVLGVVVDVGPTFVRADRRGLLGDLLADLTCGDVDAQQAALETLNDHQRKKGKKA